MFIGAMLDASSMNAYNKGPATDKSAKEFLIEAPDGFIAGANKSPSGIYAGIQYAGMTEEIQPEQEVKDYFSKGERVASGKNRV